VVTFWLGCHNATWLTRSPVRLFLSARQLARRVSLPRASVDWALDSGAFTELSRFGSWQTSAEAYSADALLYSIAIGRLRWVAPQDWPCEPLLLSTTGLSVSDHQRRTTDNFLLLRRSLGSLVVPVVQGWEPSQYLAHVEQYAAAGISLSSEPLVGVGSVCRRQRARELRSVLEPLAGAGLKLHGFGVKSLGLRTCSDLLTSADSSAWSYHARRRDVLPGCSGHHSCSNCLRYALWWRSAVAGVQ
jgi:hypothetical protein